MMTGMMKASDVPSIELTKVVVRICSRQKPVVCGSMIAPARSFLSVCGGARWGWRGVAGVERHGEGVRGLGLGGVGGGVGREKVLGRVLPGHATEPCKGAARRRGDPRWP